MVSAMKYHCCIVALVEVVTLALDHSSQLVELVNMLLSPYFQGKREFVFGACHFACAVEHV